MNTSDSPRLADEVAASLFQQSPTKLRRGPSAVKQTSKLRSCLHVPTYPLTGEIGSVGN
ncbi:hypothetical protein RESH_03844 [Rhodopirellula europaea SH398]|uniref:Uncharacterized protein n=1 Tax=Rhodopirellula europaea SH398 TaxID=1263868 RepID=M5S2D0_9BACT|nr:hypothetical protein RESH_03844 [Rhodopirellula europaea SH398]